MWRIARLSKIEQDVTVPMVLVKKRGFAANVFSLIGQMDSFLPVFSLMILRRPMTAQSEDLLRPISKGGVGGRFS